MRRKFFINLRNYLIGQKRSFQSDRMSKKYQKEESLELLVHLFKQAETLKEQEEILNRINELKGKVPVDLLLEYKERKKSEVHVVPKKKL